MKHTILILLAALCASCTHPYYGHTETEWNNMSEKQRNAFKAEYKQVLDSRRSQQHDKLIDERTQEIIYRGAGVTDKTQQQ